jgi:hypothetical protein
MRGVGHFGLRTSKTVAICTGRFLRFEVFWTQKRRSREVSGYNLRVGKMNGRTRPLECYSFVEMSRSRFSCSLGGNLVALPMARLGCRRGVNQHNLIGIKGVEAWSITISHAHIPLRVCATNCSPTGSLGRDFAPIIPESRHLEIDYLSMQFLDVAPCAR